MGVNEIKVNLWLIKHLIVLVSVCTLIITDVVHLPGLGPGSGPVTESASLLSEHRVNKYIVNSMV